MNILEAMQYLGTVEKEYDRYLEEINEPASEKVVEAYQALRRAFEEYLGEVESDEWKRGI